MQLRIQNPSFAFQADSFVLILKKLSQTHICEKGRKENESEWERESTASSSSSSLCLQSLRKKIQKSTALEFRQHPTHAAARTRAHLHIYSPVNGPSLSHLSLVIHPLLQTPPAFAAMHFTPNRSPPGWRDTLQCVYGFLCDEVTRSRWTGDTRNSFWASQLIPYENTPTLGLCLTALVSWIQIELPSHAIVRERQKCGMALVTWMNMSELAGFGNCG